MKHTNFWDEVERYKQNVDWFMVIGCGGLVALGCLMLAAIVAIAG